MKKIFIAVFVAILLIFPYTLLKGETKILLEENDEGDAQPVAKLQWFSPNGELPGTYEEYILRHPLSPAKFGRFFSTKNFLHTPQHSISILIDENIYDEIEDVIKKYISDLENEGYSVFLQSVYGGTPEEIKEWVRERYEKGSEGIVFVGDITACWAEVSNSVFPCDLFYMDLDGNWEDRDNDGDYEIHTSGEGDMAPEVYVARINAHTLTYDTESSMINDYFNKTHEYRTGKLFQPWRGLEYIDEDWYDMDVNLDLIYGSNVTRHDYGYYTTGKDYLKQMSIGQHFVQVCAHSYSGGHYFSTRPTESASYAHVYVYSPSTINAKLLLGSDDGIKVWLNGENIYTNDRYGRWRKDSYTADVLLEEGWNRLLCKISQEGGDYKFSARFTDKNYNTISSLKYQVNNPSIYGSEGEFIRGWLLNGFHYDTSDRFWDYLTTNYLGLDEGSINPEEGDVMGGCTWERYDTGYPYVDMGDYCNNADYGVCYAFTRIYSENEKNCQLWIGYDDGARIWLNGEEILYDNRYGGFEADMKKVNVTLHPGENKLLIKISEWMGSHGFSARFCYEDGSVVEGLTYEFENPPITYIGEWLINGPYLNTNRSSRLSKDYLGGEGEISPSEGDIAPFGKWEKGIGNACPFDIGNFFNHGDWVFSEDIQNNDPPVLFYNLFACGPGRFTDENYLAGTYIFHTTYGLITIASSKSGSMLNFDDFTHPLGEGKSIGEAFKEWFVSQAPYQQWEKEWYYGMVICGDPTLHILFPTKVDITKPENGIYIKNKKVFPFFTTLIIGEIDIEADATSASGIERVEFYIDNEIKAVDNSYPYNYTWDEKILFRHKHVIKVIAYDYAGNKAEDEIRVWKFK
ncbi:MAG TPA: hypothetical protein ENI33_01550 [Thermoplasmatales archaeon]|nr:hypothetical protein [Thermoplasmatales archaeon]